MEQAAESIAQWMNDILVWVGFGTLVGLLARLLMPGRDPGGALANLSTGVGGTVFGCGAFSFFLGERVTPISPVGALVATLGALSILFFYKLLAGYIFQEGETNLALHRIGLAKNRRRSTRRAA